MPDLDGAAAGLGVGTASLPRLQVPRLGPFGALGSRVWVNGLWCLAPALTLAAAVARPRWRELMTVQRRWSHETCLDAQAISASEARAFVSRHLIAHDLADLVEDIQLVVSELATNATVHAQTQFTVTLGASRETVRLDVLDGSHVGPSLVLARSLDMGGRGVAIVSTVSRAWGVTSHASGGKSVWAEFDIRDTSVSALLALSGEVPAMGGH